MRATRERPTAVADTNDTNDSAAKNAAPHARAGGAGADDPRRERFTAHEIAQVLSHYDLGVISAIREYRRGSRRAAKLKLVSERGEHLLKRRASGRIAERERDRAAASHRLQQIAAKAGVPVATLVPLRTGGTLLELDGRLYELFSWIPGTRFARHAEQARAAGIALSRLHGAFAGLELLDELPLGGFSAFASVRTTLRQALERASDGASADAVVSLHASIDGMLTHLDRVESKLAAKGLAMQRTAICHGDFHPGNTLWSGDVLAAVIDFDSARHESIAAEIANAMLQFSIRQRLGENPLAWPVGLDPENLRSFATGYAAAPAIELAEIAPLVPWLMMSAIMAEAASPIARDGDFAGIPAEPFLKASLNLIDWISQRTRAVAAVLGD